MGSDQSTLYWLAVISGVFIAGMVVFVAWLESPTRRQRDREEESCDDC